MKSYIRYLFVLTVLLISFDRSASFLIDELLKFSNFRFVNIGKENPDYFVIGNSRGVNSVKESQFDSDFCLDVLNISYNGLKPNEIKYLIKKINTTKPILIEISPFLRTKSSSFKSPKSNNLSDESKRFSVFKNLRSNKFDLLNLYRFNDELFLRSLYYIFSSDKSWGNNKVLDPVKKNILINNLMPVEIDSYFLHDFVKFLNQNNVNYLFYYAPIHPEMKKSILNWDLVNLEVQELLKNKYLDLSDLIDQDSSFADFIHTNGREQFLIHNTINNFLSSNNIICFDQ